MEFSVLKLRVMNAVNAYFNRNWNKGDMMSSGQIQEHARTSLKRVHLTLFSAMLAATFGSYLHLIWEAGGLFTVLCCVASLRWLYFTSPWRVRKRVTLLMVAAFFFGASVGLLTKYFFEINQGLVVRLLADAAIVFGCFWFGAKINSERGEIYFSAMSETCAAMHLCFDIANWTLKAYAVLVLFMVYLVVYSQEILYDALYGDVNFVNCTFTVFFCLPAIVVHAARLCLGANIE